MKLLKLKFVILSVIVIAIWALLLFVENKQENNFCIIGKVSNTSQNAYQEALKIATRSTLNKLLNFYPVINNTTIINKNKRLLLNSYSFKNSQFYNFVENQYKKWKDNQDGFTYFLKIKNMEIIHRKDRSSMITVKGDYRVFNNLKQINYYPIVVTLRGKRAYSKIENNPTSIAFSNIKISYERRKQRENS